MAMGPEKQKNVDFFKRELVKWLADPLLRDKFVVIHAQKLQKTFDQFDVALQFAADHFPNDEFIVQQVVDESEEINFSLRAV